jgi:hypothetical protein
VIWKLGFAVAFFIAGLRASRMLNSLYHLDSKVNSQPSHHSHPGAVAPVGAAPGAAQQSSPLTSPKNHYHIAASVIHGTNGDAFVVGEASQLAPPSPLPLNNDTTTIGIDQLGGGNVRGHSIATNALTTAMNATTAAQIKQEREHRMVIRKTTFLTIGGSLVCVVQVCHIVVLFLPCCMCASLFFKPTSSY